MRFDDPDIVEIPDSVKNGIKPLEKPYTEWKHYGLDVEAEMDGKLYSIQMSDDDDKIYAECSHFSESQRMRLIADFTTEQKAIIWSHNSSYDVGQIFKEFIMENEMTQSVIAGWDVEKMYPHPTYFKCTKKKRVLIFSDTFQFFRTSLDNAGDILGIGSKEYKPDYLGKRVPDKKEIDEFVKYAIKDAELVRKVGKKGIDQIHKESDVYVDYSVSSASLSSKIFRREFLNRRIPYPKPKGIEMKYMEKKSDHDIVTEMGLRSYNGGRTESFCFGTTKAEIFDYSSHYPSAMSNIKIPVEAGAWRRVEDYVSPHAFYYIKAKVPNENVLPFPVFRDRLMFPAGKLKGVVTGYEAKQIVKHCEIEEIEGIIYTGETNESFTNFVKKYYRKKNEAKANDNTVDYWRYKLLLNSLYGKTLQTVDREQGEQTVDLTEKEKEEIEEGSVIAGGMFNSAIGSWITGWARAKLFEDMKKEDADILYCDTDSIGIKTQSSYDFEIGEGLGALEKEASGYGTFLREKLYLFSTEDGEILKAGRHAFWRETEDMIRMIGKMSDTYQVRKMIKLKEAYRRGMKPFSTEFMERTIDWVGSNKRKQIEKIDPFDNFKMLEPLEMKMW